MSVFGALVGAIAPSIIGGLFQSSADRKNRRAALDAPRTNILSQAKGVREAAERYGFNPLTLLEHGQPAGAMGGGGGYAPLASVETLTGLARDVSDILSGDAARRRQADQLEVDLAKLKLEQARSGVVAVGPGVSPLGRTATARANNGGARFSKPFSMSNGPSSAPNAIAPGRKKDIMELPNSPGVFEIDNNLTNGPVTIPGDTEPWGIDELATAVLFGVPQAGYKYGKDLIQEAKDWPKMTQEKKANSKTMKAARRGFKYPPNAYGLVRGAIDFWQ